jgi:hypothetical protein
LGDYGDVDLRKGWSGNCLWAIGKESPYFCQDNPKKSYKLHLRIGIRSVASACIRQVTAEFVVMKVIT